MYFHFVENKVPVSCQKKKKTSVLVLQMHLFFLVSKLHFLFLSLTNEYSILHETQYNTAITHQRKPTVNKMADIDYTIDAVARQLSLAKRNHDK